MKRRHFFGITAGGAASLMCPAPAGAASAAVLSHPRLLELLQDRRLVRELGERYRALVPAESDADALTRAILPQAEASSAAVLRDRLDDDVRRDFNAGRTVTVNGWILSVTEARQCALYSLQTA